MRTAALSHILAQQGRTYSPPLPAPAALKSGKPFGEGDSRTASAYSVVSKPVEGS